MADNEDQKSKKQGRAPLWRRAVKAVALTVMGLVLFVTGLTAVSLSLLTPERLTPIVRKLATTSLQNCRVDIDRVSIGLKNSYPFFTLKIENLAVVSTTMPEARAGMALPDSIDCVIPEWADTVFAFREFKGGINVATLMGGKIVLSDVTIDSPGANIVAVTDKINNFNIFKESDNLDKDDKEFDLADLPEIKIKRFAILNPRPWRYLDFATGTEVTAEIDSVTIDGAGSPLYALDFNGNVESPQFMEYLALKDVRFGLNGELNWDQRQPRDLSLKGFNFELALLKGTSDVSVNFGENLTVKEFDVVMEPIEVKRALSLIPARDSSAVLDVETEAVVGLKGRLLRPFIPAKELIPHARVEISVPDAELRWENAQFDNVGAEITVDLGGADLNKTIVKIERLNVRGPATDLTVSGSAENLMSNPVFDGRVDGKCDLSRLPNKLVNLLPGRFNGHVTAAAHFAGDSEMLKPHRFHELHVDGKVVLDKLYWLAADTTDLVFTNHAVLDFGTDNRFTDRNGNRTKRTLSVILSVDSAAVLHDVLSMHVRDFKIGLGAANRRVEPNKKTVIPMGGKVSIGRFQLVSLSDSAMVRVSNASGRAIIGPHNGDYKTPEFAVDLGIERVVTGDRSTRLMMRGARASLTAFKELQGKRLKAIGHISDSIRKEHPRIPMDSVYAMALDIHNKNRKYHPRTHTQMESDSTEIIDWSLHSSFRRVLQMWAFKGQLQGQRAALFTPYFPVSNRLSDIDITFNNDSVNINSLRYKAGRSDFRLSGTVNNVRRALTSTNGRQPMRVVLDLNSDTINVNQIAETAFAGSAYASMSDSVHHKMLLESDDEDEMQKAINSTLPADNASKMQALLIPKNISAELNIRAKNVVYSDLLLHDLTGKVLSYQGSLNLNGLHAASDVGSVDLSALYQGRSASNLKFGFGLRLNDFNIKRFLRMVPAVDSLMPLLRDFGGIISADIAATTDITPQMDFNLPTLDAAIKLEGDSLILLDPDTFKSLSKWLMFKNKKENVIKHMQVQMLVENNNMQMYPFIFDIDRYHLGVMGHNDFALNFDYHIAVLKSPIPFKFGINIKGNPDDFKIRLGKARLSDNTPVNYALVDSTRVNLVNEIENVFRRGINAESIALRVKGKRPDMGSDIDEALTPADSMSFISVGLLDAPDTVKTEPVKKKGRKKRDGGKTASVGKKTSGVMLPLTMMAILTRRRKDNE